MSLHYAYAILQREEAVEQDAGKVALLTRPAPARQDAPFPRLRSRVAQRLNVKEEFLGGRKHCRGFSARQDSYKGRTAHTKCGLYLLASSLAAALPVERRVSARRGWAGEKAGLFEHPARVRSCCPRRTDK